MRMNFNVSMFWPLCDFRLEIFAVNSKGRSETVIIPEVKISSSYICAFVMIRALFVVCFCCCLSKIVGVVLVSLLFTIVIVIFPFYIFFRFLMSKFLYFATSAFSIFVPHGYCYYCFCCVHPNFQYQMKNLVAANQGYFFKQFVFSFLLKNS